jgi:hypothetical protein
VSEALAIGAPCSLYIDLQPERPAPVEGDWIATEAGSRYLVQHSRLVQSRKHDQRRRYALRCARLPNGCEIPADVHVQWMRWYSRSRRR